MELNLKKYKYSKFKKELQVKKLLLVFNVAYTKNDKWIYINQTFRNLNINLLKVANKTSRLLLINSIYSNYKFLINNFVMMATMPSSHNLKELTQASANIHLLGIKLQNKIYTRRQLQNVGTIHFTKSMKLLTKKLNFCIKIFSVKLSK